MSEARRLTASASRLLTRPVPEVLVAPVFRPRSKPAALPFAASFHLADRQGFELARIVVRGVAPANRKLDVAGAGQHRNNAALGYKSDQMLLFGAQRIGGRHHENIAFA